MRYLLFIFLMVTSGMACNNNGVDEAALPAGELFLDYRIYGEEGKDSVNIILQFKNGGIDGEAVSLSPSASVTLDGSPLQPDSTKMSGTFYEAVLPLTTFAGQHTISFTDAVQGSIATPFNFQPFYLAEPLTDKRARQPFKIVLADFSTKPTKVHLVLTDTSFATPDINEEIKVEGATIFIQPDDLSAVGTGPVILRIVREEEQPIKNGLRKRGRILLTYGLQSDFEFIK